MSDELHEAEGAANWKILLVDDEPEVHEVSRLILGDVEFEGRGIDLLCAESATQAREMLMRHDDVALVLLDVVMESDDAGLALVHHIRDQLLNRDVQIVLRTGQPGMAPELEVVMRYEINGYCLKTDVTAQRLHSMVISALRSYRYARSLRARPQRGARHSSSAVHDPARSALAVELVRNRDSGAVLMQAQPEVVLASNHVSGIELVPQWRTSLGLLPAMRVYSALPDGAERRPIALWLLTQACRWARSWQASQGRTVTVSLPLLAEGLADPATLEAAVETVRSAALAPGALDLLVSETTLLSSDARVHAAIALLRSLGVTFTLADFGAEVISLQRLARLLPDRVKIHRLFVRDVADHRERMALARSLIALAQTLKITAIADGISSDSDAQFFKWEGCDLGQGDGLVAACAPADVVDLLHHGRNRRH